MSNCWIYCAYWDWFDNRLFSHWLNSLPVYALGRRLTSLSFWFKLDSQPIPKLLPSIDYTEIAPFYRLSLSPTSGIRTNDRSSWIFSNRWCIHWLFWRTRLWKSKFGLGACLEHPCLSNGTSQEAQTLCMQRSSLQAWDMRAQECKLWVRREAWCERKACKWIIKNGETSIDCPSRAIYMWEIA